jgi:hypothetical protein
MVHNMDDTEVLVDRAGKDEKARPSRLAIATGLNAAIAISYLFCKPPQTHTLSWTTRLSTSALYLVIVCLAGALGTWIALSREHKKQFRSLVLWGMRGWIFLPAIMMFLRERSIWAPMVAVLAASLMAADLRRLTGEITHPSSHDVEKNIFITQLHFEPLSWIPIAVSLCLYGAVLSALKGDMAFVTLLLAAGAFLLVSRIIATHAKQGHQEATGENTKTILHSPYSWLPVAILCAFIALSSNADLAWEMRAFSLLKKVMASPKTMQQHPSGDHSSSGYQTIVLWPLQKKEKMHPSPSMNINPLSGNIARPWVIPFYGPYWYFKIPGESPGPKARVARGDPLKVNVHSTDRHPLLMEAHQNLDDPVDLSCCREMQVVLRNDVSMGVSQVGISLTDSHSKGTQSESLGIEYVDLNSADRSPGNALPVEETISFPFPKSGKITKFDRITVIFFPDAEHLTVGRKVAVERFVMIPN